MHRSSPTPGAGLRAVAGLAASRPARVVAAAWLLTVGPMAALAYLTTVGSVGATGPVGGAVFITGLCLVATVARNASAEAARPGSVRRGSLLRAAAFGVTVHGGLLAAVSTFSDSAVVVAVWVVLGGALVVATRPATLASLGADAPPAAPAVATQGPERMRTNEILSELRSGAARVRAASDPVVTAELAERRGVLIDELLARNPDAVNLLFDQTPVRPTGIQRPQGPDAD